MNVNRLGELRHADVAWTVSIRHWLKMLIRNWITGDCVVAMEGMDGAFVDVGEFVNGQEFRANEMPTPESFGRVFQRA